MKMSELVFKEAARKKHKVATRQQRMGTTNFSMEMQMLLRFGPVELELGRLSEGQCY